MEDLKLDAVSMVRQIRDQGYEILKGMSAEEEIRYFQEESAKFRAEMAERRLTAPRSALRPSIGAATDE